MTKSEVAFRFTAANLFEDVPEVYFWTFTFKEVMPDWYYSNTFCTFLRALQDIHGNVIQGLKVLELHKDHGLHFHCLLSERVSVHVVRRLGKRYGIGRVHVKRADAGSIDYLAKYISKQFKQANKLFGKVSRWGTIGPVRKCRVRDVEVTSPYHDALAVLKRFFPKGIPYMVVCAAGRICQDLERVEFAARYFLETRSLRYFAITDKEWCLERWQSRARHGNGELGLDVSTGKPYYTIAKEVTA